MILVKFLFVVSFLESYHLYQYLGSDSFLVTTLSMIKEAATITNQSFANFLLYQVLIEIVATNSTATVFNQPAAQYLNGYLDTFSTQLQTFL